MNPLLIVTGMAGAGRSLALKTLEDLGYETVDNLPLFLLNRLFPSGTAAFPQDEKASLNPSFGRGGKSLRDRPQNNSIIPGDSPDETPLCRPLALGIDNRSHRFDLKIFFAELQRLRSEKKALIRLVFLECDDEVLCRRYTETRRPHPFAENGTLLEGIHKERALSQSIHDQADLVIDTSLFQPADFRRVLAGHFRLEPTYKLSIFIVSFAYRHGLPREADLVFDARVLSNPHYQDDLRPLSGLDAPVAQYIWKDPGVEDFLNTLKHLIHLTLSHCEKEERSYLTIALGCTGGRHRSVFVAEVLGKWLTKLGQKVQLTHHDINKTKEI